MTLKLSIMVPDRLVLNDQVDEIILPSNTGQMGVLKNHALLITGLDIGIMLVRNQTKWKSVALMGGFALVQDNKVTVLVNQAEFPEDIDASSAKSACESAEAKWSQATGQKERVEANLSLKRARIRYKLATT